MNAPFSLARVPAKPGCYLYKDENQKIIYIGKAKHLRKRVSQYFQKSALDDKTALLVRSIQSVDFFVTKTEHEALLLEANLIRKHKPKYNIDLKNGRRYAYILLTTERFPRLLTVRDTAGKGTYFGPYTSGLMRQAVLKTLRDHFFIRTCRILPKKPCLRYHLGLCLAPCAGLQSEKEYALQMKRAVSYLKGKGDDLLVKLEKEMEVASAKELYEIAKQRRDQIVALKALGERQIVESADGYYEDAINYVVIDDDVHVLVFHVRGGVLIDKDSFIVPFSEDFFDEFLRRYYEDQKQGIPSRIHVPVEVDRSLAAYLSRLAGRKVSLPVPKRGAKKEMLDLIRKNIESLKAAPTLAMEELQKHIPLPKSPRVLECFDISHLQGTNMVGSMVQFVDGQPNRSGYRRFKIKTLDQIDDFRAIREIVGRRYKRLLNEAKPLPDLIVIDGGAEQLRFAIKAIDEVGVDIPIIALAKKFEEIYTPWSRVPKRFAKSSEMMKLLIRLRDEAHRFAVTYHRLLRSKKAKQ